MGSGADAFLGVTASATGLRWQGPGAETLRTGLAISQVTGLPEIVGLVLAARGVAPDDAADYLAPTLRALMPDPSELADMDTAASRLAEAVRRRQRIAVFGDYDVDGAASVALVLDWLAHFKLEATPYIPDRIDEGYGPNVSAMTALAQAHDLIICVDCGTLSHDPIAAARSAGAEVIVVDHHLAPGILPDATVVNPNREDDRSEMGHLCAAGVVFLLLVATNRTLRGLGHFDAPGSEPDLRIALDLVAVATVADVAPLIGLNRAFVRQGLSVMAQRGRSGIAALGDIAGLSAPPTTRDLAFAFGPRLNAGGRVGTADLGLRLLSARDPHEAVALAEKLDVLNTERRAVEAAVLDAALAQVEDRGADGPLVWAAGRGWHAGVVGIVASRLKEKFNRPAVVIGLDGATEEGKGSGRSVPGVDLGSAVRQLVELGLLRKGGGHRSAAGLTVAASDLEPAMERLAALLAQQGAGTDEGDSLRFDGALAASGVTLDLIAQIDAAGPFGQANPAPRFAIADCILSHARPVGEGHCQLRIGKGGGALSAIAFRAVESGLMALFQSASESGRPVHLAGRLERDDWGGRSRAKLRVDDAALADVAR